MDSIEGGSSSSLCGKARQSLVWIQKQKHIITLCLFSSFQTSAGSSNKHRKAQLGARIDGKKHTHTPTHTADDSYKYHRTRVRSDSYTIFSCRIDSISKFAVISNSRLLKKYQVCLKTDPGVPCHRLHRLSPRVDNYFKSIKGLVATMTSYHIAHGRCQSHSSWRMI